VSVLIEDHILPALLRKLDDTEFHRQFEFTASTEHSFTIKMLHFINDLDRRKSYLELGYSSVFDYCVRKIEYSSSEAGRRIQAARCCRRYPELFECLRNREVCITTLAMIESIITDDNKDEIVARIRGASRRAVERLISEYRPAVNLRDRIRYVQVPQPKARSVDGMLFDRECKRAVPEEYRDQPRVEEKVFVEFLADEEFLALFEEVRNLMSNSSFDSFADVIKRVLQEYCERHSPVARHERREKKRVNGPDSHRWECKSTQPEWSRHIPDEIRDEVLVRDNGQCTFVGSDGVQCQCKKGLQIDHIKPFAAGGTHDLSNLRLLCGAHNRLAAERTLGKHVMQPFWRRQ
jgi:5-methylcytosine-specific restriction endonuclease McrA